MFTKLLCPKRRICLPKASFHLQFNLPEGFNKLVRGDTLARDHPVNVEDVCCTLNTRKVNDHLCRGPQDHYIEPTTIKLLIHGWLESRHTSRYRILADQYLQRENYNVIRVDYAKIAALRYMKSVQYSVSVGKIVAVFLVKLLEARITTHEKIHIIGHSLGAHIAGIAGKEVARITGTKLGRITGLDPAKQLYEIPSCPPEVRLNCTDASMVDVTHTDTMVFGFKEPLGTVDFYINGIGIQPGCAKPKVEVFTSLKELDKYVFCSHRRSCKHFAESINNSQVVGYRCNDLKDIKRKVCDTKETVVYGENISPRAEGLYFVKTTC